MDQCCKKAVIASVDLLLTMQSIGSFFPKAVIDLHLSELSHSSYNVYLFYSIC